MDAHAKFTPTYCVDLLVEWMRRQPQARQTKQVRIVNSSLLCSLHFFVESLVFLVVPHNTPQKARIEAFYKLEKSTKPRVTDPSLEISDKGQRRLGGNILKVTHRIKNLYDVRRHKETPYLQTHQYFHRNIYELV